MPLAKCFHHYVSMPLSLIVHLSPSRRPCFWAEEGITFPLVNLFEISKDSIKILSGARCYVEFCQNFTRKNSWNELFA